MNYDRKRQEEELYNKDVIDLRMAPGCPVPLEKDFKFQMDILKKQLQMVLDDERGPSDLDKKISILETQNRILTEEKKFLIQTLKEYGILTNEIE